MTTTLAIVQQLFETAERAGIDRRVLLDVLSLDPKISDEQLAELYPARGFVRLTTHIKHLTLKYKLPRSRAWLCARGLEYLSEYEPELAQTNLLPGSETSDDSGTAGVLDEGGSDPDEG